MGIFSKFFSGKNQAKFDGEPSMYGGDGLSAQTPVIVNCASMGMAQALIDVFLKRKCGPDSKRDIELTIADSSNPDKHIKLICVTAPDGSEHKFYFDLTRPLATAMHISGL